jgi:hypothetical protein
MECVVVSGNGDVSLQLIATYSNFAGFVLIFAITLNSFKVLRADLSCGFVLKNIRRSSMHDVIMILIFADLLQSLSKLEFGRVGMMFDLNP